jgi:hypothetical protein
LNVPTLLSNLFGWWYVSSPLLPLLFPSLWLHLIEELRDNFLGIIIPFIQRKRLHTEANIIEENTARSVVDWLLFCISNLTLFPLGEREKKFQKGKYFFLIGLRFFLIKNYYKIPTEKFNYFLKGVVL